MFDILPPIAFGVALINSFMSCFTNCLTNMCYVVIISIMCFIRLIIYVLSLILVAAHFHWLAYLPPGISVIVVIAYLFQEFRLIRNEKKLFAGPGNAINQPLLNIPDDSSNPAQIIQAPVQSPPTQYQIPVQYGNPDETTYPGPPMTAMNNAVPNNSNIIV